MLSGSLYLFQSWYELNFRREVYGTVKGLYDRAKADKKQLKVLEDLKEEAEKQENTSKLYNKKQYSNVSGLSARTMLSHE